MSLETKLLTSKPKIKDILKTILVKAYRECGKLLPMNKNIILFESNLGRNYTGNPRAIYEELVAQGLDLRYHCYFILDNPKLQLPGAAKRVKRKSLLYFYLFAIAGIWVCDTRLPKYIAKRPGCTYIQTWHGTPLKKLALDMVTVFMAGENGIDNYKKNFYDNTRTWDYLISQNHYSTDIFRRAFAFSKEILEIGYPRNDVLFHKNNPEDILELKKQLKLPLDKKIILYAPTWRDNEYNDKGKYKFNPPLDFMELRNRLGDDTIMIVKYHYLVMDQIDWTLYQGFIYPCDLSYDISVLYLVSDMMITDYSSVMFDYSLLKRPLLFFCYDLTEYKDTLRGFYFDFLKEVPGPVAQNTKELIDAILNYDAKRYQEKLEAFYSKYNHADDGNATKRVVELIRKITK